MKVTFNQHIGIFKNIVDSQWCNKIIDLYNQNQNLTKSRFDNEDNISPLSKNDYSLPTNIIDEKIKIDFNKFLGDAISKYNEKYTFQSWENDIYHYEINDFKVQKTLPTEGYHMWHYENESLDNRHRILTWMLYLNDVKEGGETEFLHQSLRVKPKKGTIVIWPAGFTHYHRGNPPLSGEKYIVTGWLSIFPNE